MHSKVEILAACSGDNVKAIAMKSRPIEPSKTPPVDAVKVNIPSRRSGRFQGDQAYATSGKSGDSACDSACDFTGRCRHGFSFATSMRSLQRMNRCISCV